jgi:hypothetical protein
MNRPLLSRIMPFLLGFYALSLAAFFASSMITFSASSLLPMMRWEYTLKRAFVLFMDYLIPVHAAAIAVAASLAAIGSAGKGGAPQPFNKILSSTLVAFLVLTAGYTALFEGVYPRVRGRLADMQYQSSLARLYARQAETSLKSRDFTAALAAMDRYLAIDTKNKDMIEKRLDAAVKAAKSTVPPERPQVAGSAEPSADLDAQALVEKAHFYFDTGDFFSAHYWAAAAFAADSRRRDALQLAADALKKIEGAATPDDQKAAELFTRKKNALARLENGDALSAYYLFVALSAENPRDKDIATYLGRAREALKETSFFLDDALKMEPVPGTQNILFLNAATAGAIEAVSIGKMVELASQEAYFYDIEAIRYDAAGNVQWHFTAPYGMRTTGNTVLMRCIDRTSPGIQHLPLYIKGTREIAERNLLALRPTPEELRALSMGRDALAGMSITELLRVRANLGAYGLARQELAVDMVMKLLMPFAFLIISLFAVSLGWAFRARYPGRLPAIGVILMPLVPIVLALLSLLYLYGHRIVAGFIVLAFGLRVALIALALLQGLLLALSLVMLAGQSTR